MYSYWNAPPYHPVRSHMYSERPENEQLLQRMAQLENQMNHLIKLMEQNNEILHSALDEQQNKVCTTGGGGAVIVRM